MTDKKIFLNNKEIESLCLSKITYIPKAQLDISKAEKEFVFAVEIDPEGIISFNNEVILLFSAVKKIEIPESENNLFKNHYKIPLGLLSSVKRKIKEVPKDNSLMMNNWKESLSYYLPIRRGLFQLLLWGYKEGIHQEHLIKLLDSFEEKVLNPVSKNFLLKVLSGGEFPELPVSNGNEKYAWWANFIMENLVKPQKENLTQADTEAHITWLKSFSIPPSQFTINQLKKVPFLLENYSGMLIGYLYAIGSPASENLLDISETIDEYLKELRYVEDEDGKLMWSKFFHSLFNEKLDYLFPNPLISKNAVNIEKLALSISLKLGEKTLDESKYKFEILSFDELSLINNYVKLKEGLASNTKIIILNEDELKKPFQSDSLFGENRNKTGFINVPVEWKNKARIEGNKCELVFYMSPNKISFFGDLTKEQVKLLKSQGVNLNVKPLSKLIDSNKKVLVFFLLNQPGYMFNAYQKLFSVYKPTKIKEMVVVNLVKRDSRNLHTSEYALEVEKIRTHFSQIFGLKTTVFTKNLLDNNIKEVIRNLKKALTSYSLKNVEVMDENFDNQEAEWLIQATNDYEIKGKAENYLALYVE